MPSENIYPIDDRLLSRSDREDTYGYKAMVFWLCGLSGSGKSTLAIGLEKFLFSKIFMRLSWMATILEVEFATT